MRAPIFDTPNIDTSRQATAEFNSAKAGASRPDASNPHASNKEQDEPVLPGLVGGLVPLLDKGRPERHVVAHGYISRGGAKRDSALVTDDRSVMRVRFLW